MRLSSTVMNFKESDMIEEMVAVGFRNISNDLKKRPPWVVDDLDRVQISESQQKAVLDTMLLMTVPEIQSLGVKIAHIIRDSPKDSTDYLHGLIEDTLRPHI